MKPEATPGERIPLRTSCLPEAPHAEDEKAEGDVVDLLVFLSLQPSHVEVSEGSNARSVLHLLHAVQREKESFTNRTK